MVLENHSRILSAFYNILELNMTDGNLSGLLIFWNSHSIKKGLSHCKNPHSLNLISRTTSMWIFTKQVLFSHFSIWLLWRGGISKPELPVHHACVTCDWPCIPTRLGVLVNQALQPIQGILRVGALVHMAAKNQRNAFGLKEGNQLMIQY